MVKLELDKNKYEKLMELVYLGNWITNAERNRPAAEYEEVEGKVYSLAGPAGFEDYVEYDKALKGFYPSKKFEAMVQKRIEQYDEANFWDGLVSRLVHRDLHKKYGRRKGGFTSLTPGRLYKEIDALNLKYYEELEKSGVDRLALKTGKQRRTRGPAERREAALKD